MKEREDGTNARWEKKDCNDMDGWTRREERTERTEGTEGDGGKEER